MKEVVKRLQLCFPGSFVNYNEEFIAHRRSNQYICLRDCENLLDVQCKVLEWFSRSCCKGSPFRTDEANEKLHRFMLDGVNSFLGTRFTEAEMLTIYIYIGNRINRELTVAFINSGYDFAVLTSNDYDTYISANRLLQKLNSVEYHGRSVERMAGGNEVLHKLVPQLIKDEASKKGRKLNGIKTQSNK